jgi:dTDP-4-amino-4,6-dideoxygalactose transaminase
MNDGFQVMIDGPPAFAEPLLVGRPNLGSSEVIHRYVQEALARRWLSNDGALVREFERQIAERVGVKHCLAVCNATAGLEIALRAADVTGEVIVPANTFVATVHALEWQRLVPVFCDIDEDTHHLDPELVKAEITPRTTAIVGVHLWGRPCCPGELEKIAQHHGLKLIFDAAHAFGCSSGGRMIGNFGLAEVFSFHATKFIGSGEGGAIVTNDDAFASRVRQMRNFGIAGCDQVTDVGVNGKMCELAAAVGLAALERMDEFAAINERNDACYRSVLAGLPGLELIGYEPQEHNNRQYVVALVDENRCPLTRDQLLQWLHSQNVIARRYFYPGVHRMQPYASRDPALSRRLPITDKVLERVLVLPTGSAIGPDEIEIIGGLIRRALESAEKLRHVLPATLVLPTQRRIAA